MRMNLIELGNMEYSYFNDIILVYFHYNEFRTTHYYLIISRIVQ